MTTSDPTRPPAPFGLGWTVHGDGREVRPGEVVRPGERLSWPRTIGLGAQHVVAMFGATFLVPLITGLPPATTLFFSGIGTMLFLLITAGRVPSYLGSSFAFIAPLAAASKSHDMPTALGGVVMAGLALALIGVVVQMAGDRWLRALMPPVVTGAIVALIGLNLAPSAKVNFMKSPVTALVTVVVILLVTVATRTLFSRIAILVGVAAGYATALLRDEVSFARMHEADWLGAPDFHAPHFELAVAGLFIPVVLVLVAENVGHIRSVASMTGEDLDPLTGRALIADGLATTLAGAGGGSGTTTYAENIGVMAATRVYSTAAYWVAALVALLLSFSPKFGEAIATVPPGVLGGAGVVLYGMIGLLGAKIWVEAKVDFGNPINLMTAAVALIIGIADFTWKVGDLQFAGIALGTVAALLGFHVMRGVNLVTRAVPDPLMKASSSDAHPGLTPPS
ncbi:NCS2 family nucleobase:cation symporter [Janibacter sp. CX7]|uniref:uracil-xanthine permease family protein n=1 Tax=Janibacter sp. CX7 TaxID=2963431 RepID=UPI0020CF6A1C|nr:solute carrier family 23 protein [Janibacter sp. CX7]UTT65017.1 NCS2 family nucleobase:cation symporter [Janibacter sp. CX7]